MTAGTPPLTPGDKSATVSTYTGSGVTHGRVTTPSEITMMLRLPATRSDALERIRIAVSAGGTLQKAADALKMSTRVLQRLIAADKDVAKIVDAERSEASARTSAGVRTRWDGEKPKRRKGQ